MKKYKANKKFNVQLFILVAGLITSLIGLGTSAKGWTLFDSIFKFVLPAVGVGMICAVIVMAFDSYAGKRKRR